MISRCGPTLIPDPRRVIVKLFVPGEDAAVVRSRANGLIDRVIGLDDERADRLLERTLARFAPRHRDLVDVFTHHYDLVRHRIAEPDALRPNTRLLIGAYFTHEYSVEAAALCNPSMVPHPDQTGLSDRQLRVAVSVRQIGEGHISSIGFCTAVLGPDVRIAVDDRAGALVTGELVDGHYRRDLLVAGIADEGGENEVSATVLDALPEHFDRATLERVIAALPADLHARANTQATLAQLRRTNADAYTATFPDDTLLHQRVLWPSTAAESNGMEDARFTRYVDVDGTASYRATYTAYDGRHVRVHSLDSPDLRTFRAAPMRGPGARNKGLALFPRPVDGRRLALCRADGETTGLTTVDGANRWGTPVPLHAPRDGWNLIQVGNCGPPIETDAGWLVLTHGVGPMRQYAIGALLLDPARPERVIAELPAPLLCPDESERDGYVPEVVYSCGGLVHAGTLWIPYGASDTRIGFATVALDTLLAALLSQAH